MMRQTLAQRRANHVLTRHQAYEGRPTEFWTGYCATADGLPFGVRTSGLALAIAGAIMRTAARGEDQSQSDEKRGSKAVLGDWADWMSTWSRHSGTGWFGASDPKDCLTQIITGDQHRYIVTQEETLGYLAWIKTLAGPHRPEPSRRDGTADGGEDRTATADAPETPGS